jgi:3-isopropylmalate dehydrogenase
MLVERSLNLPEAAQRIESAVASVLEEGFRTADLARPGQTSVGTARMGDLVTERM